MIYAKFSSRFNFSAVTLLAAASLISCPITASAQDTTGYTPPPMYDDKTPPMVPPEAKDGYIVTPKDSPQPVEQQSPQARPSVITPRTSVDPVAPSAPVSPNAPSAATPPKMMKPIVEGEPASAAPSAKKEIAAPEAKAPVPPQKPAAQNVEPVKAVAVPRPKPMTEPKKVETSNATKGNTVTKAPVSSEEQRTSPVKRDPSVSAIQGPKTMPALPAQGVDKQALPDAAAQNADGGETILERHQKEAKASREEIKPIVPAPKAGVAPASFDRGENDALKKSIPFEPGQIGLKPDVADPVAAGVSKELDDESRKEWRVQIKAYATPHGTGLSSDRRIALSRALSLRSTLITQGIPASKIDVMAEGLEAENGKPGDRIDLYLYGPKQR